MITELTTKPHLMAFSYFGGKNAHLKWLLPILKEVPAHSYVELFAGSAAVALNMNNKVITINDINRDIVNFFEVLRNDPETLLFKLELTPYSREEYKKAWNPELTDRIERARNFYIRVIQSFGSCGIQKEYNSWSYTRNSSRCNISSEVSAWLKNVGGLRSIVEKLREFQIENLDYSIIIQKHATQNSLIYADPPYPIISRTGNIRYAHEFTDADHKRLASLLIAAPGYVAISSYRCSLMDELYKGFYISMDRNKRTNSPTTFRQECLYTNFKPSTPHLINL